MRARRRHLTVDTWAHYPDGTVRALPTLHLDQVVLLYPDGSQSWLGPFTLWPEPVLCPN